MSSLENPFPAAIARASAVERQHKRTVETRRNHHFRPNKCPTNGWYSAAATHASTNCSSIEMRIVNSRHRAFAIACVKCLREGAWRKLFIWF